MRIFKQIAPIFAVRDLGHSLEFYRRLGFHAREYEGGGYGFVTRGRIELHLGQEPDPSKFAHSSAYLWVADADELAEQWLDAGADVRRPEDTEWGQHEGVLVDPDGNIIRFGSPIARADDAHEPPATSTDAPSSAPRESHRD